MPVNRSVPDVAQAAVVAVAPSRGGGIASAMTERLYEDRADGSRAVSTK